MKERYFEVSAEWMKACGRGNEARIFKVLETSTNLIGGQGFDGFVVVEDGNYTWTLAFARGKFVA